jgi:flavodoxin I
MSKIGIFFGTDSGTTRLVAKKIYKALGEGIAAKPQNVNRTSPEDLLAYDALIVGTPSYGVGEVPGVAVGCTVANWAEFLPLLEGADFSGKRVAVFGTGNQDRYPTRFASSTIHLYRFFQGAGAEIVGQWSTEGYQFEHSDAIVDGRFVGLILDERTQYMHTDERIAAWLKEVRPLLLERCGAPA